MRNREKGTAVDYVGHFEREAAVFEEAARRAAGARAAPDVPSCPEWVVTDLVLHLGMVHRLVARLVGERIQQPPTRGDPSWLRLAGEWAGWLPPGRAPRQDPVPAGLLDWFGAGAAQLAECFRAAEPGEQVWTWSPDHTVGFWQRMQAIEAAVHRWDAENALGAAGPLDAALAVDAFGQTLEFLVPMRRDVAQAPPGQGERFAFRRTDGPESWAVRFDGEAVRLGEDDGQDGRQDDSQDDGQDDGGPSIQISGTASDLALFLWQRPVTGRLDVRGDSSLLERYFVLVPPL
jgi:uncharacterized protein (TIGR03083 family)